MRNWAGNVAFAAAQLRRPRTVEQLQDLVAHAERIRALGTGHSFNRIADTTGDLVSVADLELPIEINADARTVTVPAGARYGEVSVALYRHGLALHNLGSLPHISVAGACATGTHGSGVGNRCLAAAVTALEFVHADGELVSVDRTSADFAGCVVSLGALGIATRVTLDVEPSYDVRQDVWLDAPLDLVLAELDDVLAAGYSVSLFSAANRPDVVDQIWIKTRGTAAPDVSGWGGHPARTPQHPIAGQDASAATEQLGVAGPWHARLPHFRLEFTPSAGSEQQSEYLVPREHGADAIRAVHALDLRGVLQIAEFRTIAADDLWLSPCHGRDSLGVHFTWVDDDAAVSEAVAAVEQALVGYDARPHWGKVFRADAESMRASYPRRADFGRLAAAHDPGRKFGNAFLERYVY